MTDIILGVDSEELRWGPDEDSSNKAPLTVPAEATIEEDKLAESEDGPPTTSPPTSRHPKRNSYQRLSRLSDDARLSFQSISFGPEKTDTDSNRSSATLKGIQINGSGGLNELDFERALKKFASERDSFLSDLTLSAGAVVPNRPKPRPKTQKIVGEDATTLKSGVGSIRRRISFRDMSAMKRQPSVMRQGKCSNPTLRLH